MQDALEKITSSFKNFVTNQGENTLENKLHRVLNKPQICYIDFLIGYFRITGFSKIVDCLGGIEEARILVGINVDRAIFNANSRAENIAQLATEQSDYFNNEANEEKHHSLHQLIALLGEGERLKIRVAPNNDVHAKLYILRDTKEPYADSDGGVIIGSSNLTYNGLVGNFEVNTFLQSAQEIDEATQIFNLLWEEAQELTLKDVEEQFLPKFKSKLKPLQPTFAYGDVFYQTLIAYFDTIIENSLDLESDMTLFKYQEDAVNSAILKLNRFNGAILGDVVGLGKTVIAVAILKILKSKTLIVAPPAIHNQWKETLRKFNISTNSYEIVSFDKVPPKSDAQLMVIDESHKLKNDKSTRYEKIEALSKIPFRKKVLLLSATLQNNSPADIANQLYLFQDKNSSNLPSIVSLEKFFTPLIAEFKRLKSEENKETVQEKLRAISDKIKEQILKPLLIRRTRSDIENFEMYKNDIECFPKVDKLNALEYHLGDLSTLFIRTVDDLEKTLKYERFRVLNNLSTQGRERYKAQNPNISDNIFNDNDLSTLAKFALIKRFESSFSAFTTSLENAIITLKQFIQDLKNNRLYVGDKSTKVLQRGGKDIKREYLYEGDKLYYVKKTKDKEEEKIYFKGIVLGQDDFKNPKKYIERLEKDLEILQALKKLWSANKKDPKLDTFLAFLETNRDKKVVVFTEYKDTLDYLQSQMPQALKSKMLFVSSENRDDLAETIAQNFDANSEIQKDVYQIIITTDTLAEGVNLHRSDTLLNYDLPWNSTKLMQRMGRINRIGSEFERLNISSFKPVDESNKVIGLLEKSFLKLQSFHYTLGEDSKILFEDEVVESFGVSEEIDEELKYLQIIRDFKRQHPEAFQRLKEIKESATQMQNSSSKAFSFFKIEDIAYFYTKEGYDYKSSDFLTFIKAIEEGKNPQAIESQIDDTIDYHIMKMNTKLFTNNDLKKSLSPSDKKAMGILKKWYQDESIDKAQFTQAKQQIEAKSVRTLSSQIVALTGKSREVIVDELHKLLTVSTEKIEIIDQADIKTKIFIIQG